MKGLDLDSIITQEERASCLMIVRKRQTDISLSISYMG